MKLHLPKVLLALVISSGSFVAADSSSLFPDSYDTDTVVSDDFSISEHETLEIVPSVMVEFSGVLSDGTTSTGSMDLVGGGTLQVSGTGNTFSGDWFIDACSTLWLKGNDATVGTGTISLSSGSILKTSGDISLTNTVTGCGILSVESGSLTIKNSVTLGQTVDNQGTLTVGEGGSLHFGSFNGLTAYDYEFEYVDPKIDEESSAYGRMGYMKGEFMLVSNADGASAYLGETVTIGGTTYSVTTKDDGNLYAQVNMGNTIEGGLYYIESGEACYNDAANSLIDSRTTGIVIQNGTLIFNYQLQDTVTEGITSEGMANVKIEEDITLKASSVKVLSGGLLVLSGSGNYDLGSSFSLSDSDVSLGGGILLKQGDGGWSGNVVLSNLTIGGKEDNTGAYITSLNNLSTDSSWVKISNVSGYAYDESDEESPTVTANLWLDGEEALTLTDGTAEATTTFSGKIKGEGNIVYSKGGIADQKFVFSGDIEQWEGSFKATGDGGSETMQFSGEAKTINATVENSGSSSLTVVIENDDDVNVNALVSNSGTGELHVVTEGNGVKNIKKKGIRATSLTINAGTDYGAGVVKLTGGTYSIGTVTVNGTTLELMRDLSDVTLTNLIINTDGVLEASNYAVTNGNITVNGYGSVVLNDNFGGTLQMKGSFVIAGDAFLNLTIKGAWETTPELVEYTLASGVTSFNNVSSSCEVDAWECFGDIRIFGDSDSSFYASRLDDVMTLCYDSEKQTLTLRYGVVPEPTTAALGLLALGGLAWRRRRG